MRCTICNRECDSPQPGELFCADCGHDVSLHVQAGAAAAIPVTPAPLPASAGSYSAQISRATPSCVIFLVDQSGSMEEAIGGGAGQKKKAAVADAINNILKSMVLSCSRETGVWHYFDVGLWIYSGAGVRPAIAPDLVPIADIAQRARLETRKRKMPDGAGGIIEQDVDFPVWVDPAANGTTPMKQAFEVAALPLQNWLARNPNSFPPIIINVTDGAYTGDSPAALVADLMKRGTSDGAVLVFNCHISKDSGQQLLFPGDATAGRLSGFQRDLYEMSSPLPKVMIGQARARGYDLEPGARGYVYNAQHVTLIEFLDIGTRAAQERME